MKQIKKQIDIKKSIIVFTVKGSTTIDDYKKIIKDVLDNFPPKLHVWDFITADLSVLPNQDLEEIMRFTLSQPNTHVIEKIAIIVPTDLSYGLGRMFEVFGEIQEKPWDLEPFRSAEKAFQWIGVNDIRKEENKH